MFELDDRRQPKLSGRQTPTVGREKLHRSGLYAKIPRRHSQHTLHQASRPSRHQWNRNLAPSNMAFALTPNQSRCSISDNPFRPLGHFIAPLDGDNSERPSRRQVAHLCLTAQLWTPSQCLRHLSLSSAEQHHAANDTEDEWANRRMFMATAVSVRDRDFGKWIPLGSCFSRLPHESKSKRQLAQGLTPNLNFHHYRGLSSRTTLGPETIFAKVFSSFAQFQNYVHIHHTSPCD